MKKRRKNFRFLLTIIIVLSIQFLMSTHSYAAYGDIVSQFSTPVPGASGLTWDGQNFWTCGNNGLIYKIATDGTVLDTIPMPDTGHIANYHPDVAWDGQFLWFANYSDYNAERAVFKLDPLNGNVLRDYRNLWIERAGDDGFGLAYSNSTLFLGIDQGSGYNRLIIIDALTGEFVKETPLPGWPRGGATLSKDTPPRVLWIGSVSRGLTYIAQINPGSGYLYSLFPISSPISGLSWSNSNLVSIDSVGTIRTYDTAVPCNANIVTVKPWFDEFCQTENPEFAWTSECSNSFTIDFSVNSDFSAQVDSYPLGNRTMATMPNSIRDSFPLNVAVYWRVRGFVDGIYSKESDTRVINKYNQPFCN